MAEVDQPVAVDGRTRHYGKFYGVADDVPDDRQLLVVWGNCQAEALRLVLASSPDGRYRTVRVPPVHELESADVPMVERVVSQAAVIVTQPVRAGYRGLPIGAGDLAEFAPSARRIVWPVIRYGGLHPFQVIVRHPSNPSIVPAGVPYHDLRTILAQRDGRTRFDEWDVDVEPERIRSAAEWSIDQLAIRENRHCDIGISDALPGLGARAAHTINHPGNEVLVALGSRVLDALGSPGPGPLQRELLGNVRAPVEQRVIDALDLDATARTTWCLDGVTRTEQEIHERQLRWYAEYPEFIDAAIDRYGELIEILGVS